MDAATSLQETALVFDRVCCRQKTTISPQHNFEADPRSIGMENAATSPPPPPSTFRRDVVARLDYANTRAQPTQDETRHADTQLTAPRASPRAARPRQSSAWRSAPLESGRPRNARRPYRRKLTRARSLLASEVFDGTDEWQRQRTGKNNTAMRRRVVAIAGPMFLQQVLLCCCYWSCHSAKVYQFHPFGVWVTIATFLLIIAGKQQV